MNELEILKEILNVLEEVKDLIPSIERKYINIECNDWEDSILYMFPEVGIPLVNDLIYIKKDGEECEYKIIQRIFNFNYGDCIKDDDLFLGLTLYVELQSKLQIKR